MKRANASNGKNKTDDQKKLSGRSLSFRSRITNGRALIEEADGRSAWHRRFRDLLVAYEEDLGGADTLSEGQRAIIRRVALIGVELEFQESRFALLREEGTAPASHRLQLYQRLANTQRRLIQTLGLHQGRKARPVDITSRIIEGLRAL